MNTILHLLILSTDPEPSNSPPLKFQNFFNNYGLYSYTVRCIYSEDVWTSK